MRTRYRNYTTRLQPAHALFSYTGSVLGCNGTTYPSAPANYPAEPDTPMEGVIERMHDGLGFGLSHGVKHRKMTYSILDNRPNPTGKIYIGAPVNGVTTYTPLSTMTWEAGYYARQAESVLHPWDLSVTMMGLPPGWSLVNPSYNEQVIINDLFDRANQLKADVLLNMCEANQMWPSIKSLATSLPNMARNWRNLRKVISTASGSYLAWKFGVSPVISDLSSIAKYSPNMGRDYERYANQAPLRISRVIPMNATFGIAPVIGSAGNSKTSYQGYPVDKCEVRYVLVVKPTAKFGTDFFKKLDHLMSRFTTSPASLAWELIPFSFVADWFVDIRGPLRELDNLVRTPPYEVLSLTRSVRYHLAADCFIDWNSPCNGAPLWNGRVSHREYKHYERTPLSHQVLYPEWKGRFGKNQAAISAALISQKLSSLAAKR
jgi:hypothetical protein